MNRGPLARDAAEHRADGHADAGDNVDTSMKQDTPTPEAPTPPAARQPVTDTQPQTPVESETSEPAAVAAQALSTSPESTSVPADEPKVESAPASVAKPDAPRATTSAAAAASGADAAHEDRLPATAAQTERATAAPDALPRTGGLFDAPHADTTAATDPAADGEEAVATPQVQPKAETAAVEGETGKPEERHA